MTNTGKNFVATLMAATSMMLIGASQAASADDGFDLVSKPIPVLIPDAKDIQKTTKSTWTPPEKATKSVYVCVSFPTMQDPYWVAVNYGIVTEAKRLGITLDILNAGSYNNLSTQINQINDCAAKGADAIMVAPISVDGVAQTISSLKKSGIPVVDFVPRIPNGEDLAGRSTIDYYQVGLSCGQYLKESVGDAAVKVALFPGPPGADWTARTFMGFKDGIAGSKITLVTNKYGDTDKNTQYNLIADTLNATPDLDWVVGNAVAADAAIGAIKAAGLEGKVKIGSTYQTEPVRTGLKNGTIEWSLNDNGVLQGSIAVDMAVLAAEGTLPAGTEVWPIPQKLTKENADSEVAASGFAPSGFKPVFSVSP
jgi:protein TorT